jgi:hypothetical protein
MSSKSWWTVDEALDYLAEPTAGQPARFSSRDTALLAIHDKLTDERLKITGRPCNWNSYRFMFCGDRSEISGLQAIDLEFAPSGFDSSCWLTSPALAARARAQPHPEPEQRGQPLVTPFDQIRGDVRYYEQEYDEKTGGHEPEPNGWCDLRFRRDEVLTLFASTTVSALQQASSKQPRKPRQEDVRRAMSSLYGQSWPGPSGDVHRKVDDWLKKNNLQPVSYDTLSRALTGT